MVGSYPEDDALAIPTVEAANLVDVDMVQPLDESRRRRPRQASPRWQPARASTGSRRTTSRPRSPLLGAMLLSRDAIAAAIEQCQRRRTSTGPPTPRSSPRSPRSTARGEPAEPSPSPRSCAGPASLEEVGGAAGARRRCSRTRRRSRARAATHAIVEEHALLRRLIGVAQRDRRDRLRSPDDVDRAPSTGPRRWSSRSPSGGPPTPCVPLQELSAESLDRLEELYGRGETITGVPDRLQRPRRAARGTAAVEPHRRRRPALDGQDGLRARHRRARALDAGTRCCSSRSR